MKPLIILKHTVRLQFLDENRFLDIVEDLADVVSVGCTGKVFVNLLPFLVSFFAAWSFFKVQITDVVHRFILVLLLAWHHNRMELENIEIKKTRKREIKFSQNMDLKKRKRTNKSYKILPQKTSFMMLKLRAVSMYKVHFVLVYY